MNAPPSCGAASALVSSNTPSPHDSQTRERCRSVPPSGWNPAMTAEPDAWAVCWPARRATASAARPRWAGRRSFQIRSDCCLPLPADGPRGGPRFVGFASRRRRDGGSSVCRPRPARAAAAVPRRHRTGAHWSQLCASGRADHRAGIPPPASRRSRVAPSKPIERPCRRPGTPRRVRPGRDGGPRQRPRSPATPRADKLSTRIPARTQNSSSARMWGASGSSSSRDGRRARSKLGPIGGGASLVARRSEPPPSATRMPTPRSRPCGAARSPRASEAEPLPPTARPIVSASAASIAASARSRSKDPSARDERVRNQPPAPCARVKQPTRFESPS